jgi:hypothetical protein
MTEEFSKEEAIQYLKDEINKHENTRDTFRQIQRDVSIKSLTAIRNWAFQVLTISSAILGISIAVGSTSPMVEHKEILPFVYLCLISTIIYGFYRLKIHMEEDLDEFPKIMGDYCKSQTKIIEAEKRCFIERTKEAFENMQQIKDAELKKMGSGVPKEGRNYDFDIIFGLFFLGLVFIGVSIRYWLGIIMSILFLFSFLKFCKDEIRYRIKVKNKKKAA